MLYTFSAEIVFCGQLVVDKWAPKGLKIEIPGEEEEFMKISLICSGDGHEHDRYVGSFTKTECLASGQERQNVVRFLVWCVNVLEDNFTALVVFAEEDAWERKPLEVMKCPLPR